MAITFKDHVLTKDSEGKWRGPSPNSSGTLTRPTLLVIHYTASGGATGDGDVAFFRNAKAKASAHFVIGRDGGIAQVVQCNKRAWHAGVSSWKGRKNCNDFSIGIELDNWGWLTKRADGTYRSYTGAQVLSAGVVEAKHKNGGSARYWEAYSPVQIQALIELTKALKSYYPSITDIVGHEDIAPRRKTDPGPAFPWQHYLSESLGNRNQGAVERALVDVTSRLNVRGGPGVGFEILTKLRRGEVVPVYEVAGEWSRIGFTSFWGTKREGWVLNTYLAAYPY